jgi:hypothetical protein
VSYSKDSSVDYKVDEGIRDTGVQLLLWHKLLYILLTFIILASFAVIVILLDRTSDLTTHNTELQATNAALQTTVETFEQRPLEATPVGQ